MPIGTCHFPDLNSCQHKFLLCTYFFRSEEVAFFLFLFFQVHQKLEPFQCEQCGKNFTRMSILKHHLKTKHLDHKPFQCHICGSSFQNSSNLKVHIDKHAAKNDGNDLQVEKPGPVECELCQRVFLRHKNYARHKVFLRQ